jgi:tetrapyrrole methylase family protein/MazG family protein
VTGGPRIDVVGLGPAGPELITAGTLELLGTAPQVFLRTTRHPAADSVAGARSFDHHYEHSETFDDVYRAIVADLVEAALSGGPVAYAVPGSPTVAERTVVLLAGEPRVASGQVTVVVHPSVSFLDLAFARLGVDPVASSVRIVDAEQFAVDAAGERGPLLVAQCWSRQVLSDVKLSVELAPETPVTVLHHLGLPDEVVREVHWEDIDRSFEPDHLTSLWVPELAAPVAAELVALDELVRTLRDRCPWDRTQTHASLGRHLLEESYEVLESIDALAAVDAALAGGATDAALAGGTTDAALAGREATAVADLEEELGDLLFQVYFHATLAAEEGRFTLADVARGVHDKLVSRHPHVFGDVTAETPDDVAANWEALKKVEKGRSSVTEGIPAALPSLALAAKLQRKAVAIGMVLPGLADEAARVADAAADLGRVAVGGDGGDGDGSRDGDGDGSRDGDGDGPAVPGVADGEGGARDRAEAVGELLFAAVGLARALGVDPETALLSRSGAFRSEVEARG